ncbi:MAG: NUDIX domain-containing protein, partial [Clostridia bacterium]|nr:NUDIX domain-containing protein [Clostridia bacterium]
RVRNMQKAAQRVMETFGGELPADYDALLTLPGIGAYTAGAIASIAFGISVPAVDGNVMRVLARLTADDTDVLSTEGKKRFTALAWELTPEKEAGRFNQALMELGETVCVPNGEPRCADCPLREECAANHLGRQAQLPIRIKQTKRRVEERRVALIRVEGCPPKVLLHKRSASGLLADMWELPNTLFANPLDGVPYDLRASCVKIGDLPSCKHLFSHIEWRMTGAVYALDAAGKLPEEYVLADLNALRMTYALPSAFRVYAAMLPQLLSEEC